MPFPPFGLFITGTDTGVGKTVVASSLVRFLRESGLRVGAYKPAVSGATVNAAGHPIWEDVEALAHALTGGGPLDDDLRHRISPQQFLAPLAPSHAARSEGQPVDDTLLSLGAERWAAHCDLLVVEGAGGLLSPLSDTRDNADLAHELGYPLVIVARAGLGTINHSRMTIEAALSRGLPVACLLLSESRFDHHDLSVSGNPGELARCFPHIPVGTLPHRIDGDLRNALASLKIDFQKLAHPRSAG